MVFSLSEVCEEEATETRRTTKSNAWVEIHEQGGGFSCCAPFSYFCKNSKQNSATNGFDWLTVQKHDIVHGRLVVVRVTARTYLRMRRRAAR